MKIRTPLNECSSLSVSEAARYIRSSRDHIYGLIKDKEVRWFYRGQRKRILRTSLEEYEVRQASLVDNAIEPSCTKCAINSISGLTSAKRIGKHKP